MPAGKIPLFSFLKLHRTWTKTLKEMAQREGKKEDLEMKQVYTVMARRLVRAAAHCKQMAMAKKTGCSSNLCLLCGALMSKSSK